MELNRTVIKNVYLKMTVGKNEKGYRLKANHFSFWSRPMKVISDVPVSRNWYNTVSKELSLCQDIGIRKFKFVTNTQFLCWRKKKKYEGNDFLPQTQIFIITHLFSVFRLNRHFQNPVKPQL